MLRHFKINKKFQVNTILFYFILFKVGSLLGIYTQKFYFFFF